HQRRRRRTCAERYVFHFRKGQTVLFNRCQKCVFFFQGSPIRQSCSNAESSLVRIRQKLKSHKEDQRNRCEKENQHDGQNPFPSFQHPPAAVLVAFLQCFDESAESIHQMIPVEKRSDLYVIL